MITLIYKRSYTNEQEKEQLNRKMGEEYKCIRNWN